MMNDKDASVPQRSPAQVVCLGELLVDFISTEVGVSVRDAPGFLKAPGGAAANVAAGLARMGVNVSFVGKVGEDEFGRFLAAELAGYGVDVQSLIFTGEHQTGLVFASLDKELKPSFCFYGNPSADMMLMPKEVPGEIFTKGSWFHFGTVSMSREPGRGATYHAVDLAKKAGTLISFDPNFRLHLWKDHHELRAIAKQMIRKIDLLKLNMEELQFLINKHDPITGASELLKMGPAAVVVTLGKSGAYYATNAYFGEARGFQVESVDTIGAGDAFSAALLSRLAGKKRFPPDREAMREAVRFACAASAICTTKMGACAALPTKEEVERFLAEAK